MSFCDMPETIFRVSRVIAGAQKQYFFIAVWTVFLLFFFKFMDISKTLLYYEKDICP